MLTISKPSRLSIIGWLALAIAALTGCAGRLQPDTATLYLIRHGETISRAVDPDRPLNSTGLKRARWLGNYFESRNLDAVYSTDITRTLQTVQPAAAAAHLDIQHYDPRELKALSETLRGATGAVLVGGHSNTTPALVNQLLRSARYDPLDDSEHSLIFVLQMSAGEVINVNVENSMVP